MYAIMKGFYSSMDSPDYDSFWSTKNKAVEEIMRYVKDKRLEQQRSSKTKELIDVYSDGDYYCYIVKLKIDGIY